MNDDFFNCVSSIATDGEVIRVTIVAATETVFEIPLSASRYFEILADIAMIIVPVMKLDGDMAKHFGYAYATPADILAIERFKAKYRTTSLQGDII